LLQFPQQLHQPDKKPKVKQNPNHEILSHPNRQHPHVPQLRMQDLAQRHQSKLKSIQAENIMINKQLDIKVIDYGVSKINLSLLQKIFTHPQK
jgi:hypothetical protein